MKIERCNVIHPEGAGNNPRQCLGDLGHNKPVPPPLDVNGEPIRGMIGRAVTGHEFNPLCGHCGQVIYTAKGDARNVGMSTPTLPTKAG